MKKLAAVLVALVTAFALVVPQPAQAVGAVPPRTQVAVYSGGAEIGTPNAHEARPALSLSKLYLGYWVLYHGTPADKGQVYEMIRVSHDGIASTLDARYPQAIGAIAGDFGLGNTARNGFWGNSTTSAADIARFVGEIRHDPVAAPLIDGMVHAAPIAADGYPQNFGTATLPGAQGTKFGWSDHRDVHATVTIGAGWVAAANTYGGASTHTNDANLVAPSLTPAPTNRPGESAGPLTAGGLIDGLSCHIPAGSSQAVAAVPAELRSVVVPGQVAQAAQHVSC